ncbi:hypothetical protein EII19_12305 [Comamonadaceae bacterium OH2310_COT-174]|nr:hypothetical protein EII19_12305 [Comamonadaceae bacterium OH2310_COT-174]
MGQNRDGLKVAMQALKNLDVDALVAAAERDAGHPIPGLRQGLMDARSGNFAQVHTPEQLQAAARKHQGAYEQRKLQAGSMRIPGGLLSAEAAQALQTLLDRGAPSKAAAINAALIAAAQRAAQV